MDLLSSNFQLLIYLEAECPSLYVHKIQLWFYQQSLAWALRHHKCHVCLLYFNCKKIMGVKMYKYACIIMVGKW